MSLQLRIGDGMLHLADEFPEMGVLAPPSIAGTPVVLALYVVDAEVVFAQAAAGAEIRCCLADMFWATVTARSRIRSGTAGTSLSMYATCHMMRSLPPLHRPSPERVTNGGGHQRTTRSRLFLG